MVDVREKKANDDRVLALDRGRRVWTAQVKPNGARSTATSYNACELSGS
jgi:hypothetical protein